MNLCSNSTVRKCTAVSRAKIELSVKERLRKLEDKTKAEKTRSAHQIPAKKRRDKENRACDSWTQFENKRLEEILKKQPLGPNYWTNVAQHVGTRTALECEAQASRQPASHSKAKDDNSKKRVLGTRVTSKRRVLNDDDDDSMIFKATPIRYRPMRQGARTPPIRSFVK
jgi:hypothetical protein